MLSQESGLGSGLLRHPPQAGFNQLRPLHQLQQEQVCGNPGRSAVVGNSRLSLAATSLQSLISSADS